MRLSFDSLVESCEAAIRAGQAPEAARLLNTVSPHKVPRVWRLKLANLCRRSGQVSLGMKFLSGLIHAQYGRRKIEPTSGELAEYAVLLLRSGAVIESLRTLEKVDTAQVPEALLYKAFAHFARWEYPQSIPHLDAYLRHPLAPYAELVGRVNLAAALVATTDYVRAAEVLSRNIEQARNMGASRLLGNCHELRAQIHIDLGEYAKAREDLNTAAQVFKSNDSPGGIFVEKWLAVIEGMEEGRADRLEFFRSRAQNRQDWESVREADLFLNKIRFRKDEFDHLYFGSPRAFYREMITRYTGRRPDSETYVYGRRGGSLMDIATGKVLDREGGEIPGRNMHLLMAALTRDFYRPRSMGGLFAEVFPGDHFNIFNSPDRLHQVLRRTRLWLRENSIPVRIEEDRGAYRLNFTGDFAFVVPLEVRAKDGAELALEKLSHIYPGPKEFSAREARELLGMPKTSFNRFIKWALENGKLRSFGKSTATLYHLAPEVLAGGIRQRQIDAA
ncbi:MAG: hypothetical protein HC902_09435 [Calothrix sp. SM1_5_4]|nr:hypothetical protein [Calothrix sp. SM1_5_4]